VELIDMTKHEGQHPRMGAVDVCPFIPCRNTTVAEADEIAKAVAKEVGSSAVRYHSSISFDDVIK
ncbi:MAG: hypothetical protein II210_00760, partial [Rikenellaceae bacterium]|nr:hypothetical protein [Rikenellaceae bacterium]